MSKKGNLAAALTQFDRKPSTEDSVADAPVAPAQAKEEATASPPAKSNQPPSRRGKKALTAYFEPEVLKQLKLLAAAEDKTIQGLLAEAINELFKKYGRPHIA